MQTFLNANQIKGNEKPFDIAGIRTHCTFSLERTVFLLADIARSGGCRRDLTQGKDSRHGGLRSAPNPAR